MTTRREFVAMAASGAGAMSWSGLHDRLPRDVPIPTPAQLEWQRDELAMFLHFGVNTFADREWGDGQEDPALFSPTALDARQWGRTARAAGFRTMILTAKHHDGFCLWPSSTTDRSVARSPWRSGNGDVVRDLVAACTAEGLKAGLYLSPWDRNSPLYGDSSRYNDLYCAQLTELLTHYGPIQEVWFDGANGEGPNGKRQVYDWSRVWQLVRRLQPQAVMFSDAGPDLRWIGNENGAAGETNWSTVDPAVVTYPGASGPGVTRMLQQGDPAGSVWRPGETDVSIRPGWFYHAAENDRVKSDDRLVELYFSSVGRNSKLLLNVPPTREGLLHATDAARVIGMRQKLDATFSHDVAANRRTHWTIKSGAAIAEIDLGKPVALRVIDLAEDISRGQIVSRYEVAASNGGPWRQVSQGTTIGCRKLDRIPLVTARKLRLTIQTIASQPRPVQIRAYAAT